MRTSGIRLGASSTRGARSLPLGHRLDPGLAFVTYEQGVEAFRVSDRLSDSDPRR